MLAQPHLLRSRELCQEVERADSGQAIIRAA